MFIFLHLGCFVKGEGWREINLDISLFFSYKKEEKNWEMLVASQL